MNKRLQELDLNEDILSKIAPLLIESSDSESSMTGDSDPLQVDELFDSDTSASSSSDSDSDSYLKKINVLTKDQEIFLELVKHISDPNLQKDYLDKLLKTMDSDKAGTSAEISKVPIIKKNPIMLDNQGGQLEFQSLAASLWTLFDHANHAHANHAIILPRNSFMRVSWNKSTGGIDIGVKVYVQVVAEKDRSFAMSTNKERIERVENELGGMQNEIQRLGQGMNDKFHHLEAMISKLAETFSQSQRTPSRHDQTGTLRTSQGESAGERQPIPPRVAKLDFPKYSGDDPTEWVNRVTQFFYYQETSEDQRVVLASYHLEGEANQWWQWLRRAYQEDGQTVTWNTFVEEMWARFGPTECEDFDEALSRVQQTGTLRDYQKEFERLGNKVHGWTQRALVGTFMGGLKPEISEEIRLFRPKTLKEAISLARMKDEQIARQRKLIRPTFSNRTTTTSPIVNKNSPATPFKKLTWEEMQRRRAQGLCFNCNKKFTAGHRCTKAQLLILEAEEEYEETLEAAPIEEASYDPKITFYALTGWTTPQTMRVKAKIGPYEIIVLIDSGSTHNFISTRLANLLKLPIIPTAAFPVKVANGEKLACQGKFENIQILIQDIPFFLTVYALPISGLDLVLGIQWLEELGTVECNWKSLTMNFNWNNRPRHLQGLNPQSLQTATIAEINKEIKQGHEAFAICFQLQLEEVTAQAAMQGLLRNYRELFQEPTQLPPKREIDHCITLKEGTEPINVRPYRYAHFQKEEIEKQVQEMLNSGLVRPSTSPFSSPVLLVKKKDGSWRFCTDYRALNDATIKDRFPIPTVDDMIDELYGAAYFTKLDLRAGYHQVRVNPSDIHKTAFRTHNGHYEYLVMPFGLCNAPSTFQAIMNSIFRPHLRKFILVFYDILIYSPTWDSHLDHVKQAMEILKQHKFFLKSSKCSFGQQELEYLGHIVTCHGVKVDNKKIVAMLSWPALQTITELRGFLGLTGYYRKFVQGYGVIARPLTNLLKKNQFGWSDEAEEAFRRLKQAMSSTPTLAMPNFQDTFIIEADASGDGIGAVLQQQGRPIAFMSRALGVSKKSWSIYAKEMLAILEAIRMWRPYILGQKFIIQTDQQSLKYLLEQKAATPEQQKWLAKLMGYEYEILYRPGRDNTAADALSRRPDSPMMNYLFVPQVTVWEEIKTAATGDDYIQQVTTLAETQPTGPYTTKNGLVFYNGRVVVPHQIRDKLMFEAHNTRIGGHSGVLRTYKRLAQQFYWPAMFRTVQQYVNNCETCQRTKATTLRPAGLLQPLPIPCQVWDDITLDFIEGLPMSQGKNTIFVVVDRLSKSAHFMSLSHPFSAKIVAERFIEGIFKLHGMPKSIVSDRDPIFISKFWQEFFKMSGTKLSMSSAYHPQSDGQTEVINRCLEQYLRSFVHQWPRKWHEYLPWAEYWYNTTYHISTGMTPFKALYGRDPPTVPQYHVGTSPVNEVDKALLTRDELLAQLKRNLAIATNRMK
ncbi:hypothetical protein KPL70_013962 [Citrus sinensis]|nr:hypothetical protein KPL70_013962 [Citrus sinensis]